MKKKLTLVLILLAGTASSQIKQPSTAPGSGAASSTITNGTTATSGCVAGGVLRSTSDLVDCGAGLTFASSTLTATNIGAYTSTGMITLPAGSTAAVPIGWAANAGLYQRTSGTVNVATGGVQVEFNAGNVLLVTTQQVKWGTAINSQDVGITRDAAGVMRVTNSSTGIGALLFARNVEAVTTTKTPSAAESGEYYTNTGDTDGATITLTNDPSVGLEFKAGVTAAFTLTIVASAGESLYANGALCSTSLTSSTVGSGAVITAAVGGSGAIWIANYTGTWSCT